MMVQMIFRKLISKNNYVYKTIFIVLLLLLSGCTKREYPKPTRDFYVNDYVNAFHPVVQNIIIIEGERLYEETKDIEDIGGAQIVFATFLVESLDDIAKYNRTDIYREWEIGKNDMGVLVLFFFTETEEDGTTFIYLEETQIEVGYKMEQYLTAVEQGRLLDNTIYANVYDDLDMSIAYLYYEIIKVVYEEVYYEYYSSFSYDMDDVQDIKDNYFPQYSNLDFWSFAWFIMFFTGTADGLWYIIVPTVFVLFGGGIVFRRNRGGGGSSGGYGIFRRR